MVRKNENGRRKSRQRALHLLTFKLPTNFISDVVALIPFLFRFIVNNAKISGFLISFHKNIYPLLNCIIYIFCIDMNDLYLNIYTYSKLTYSKLIKDILFLPPCGAGYEQLTSNEVASLSVSWVGVIIVRFQSPHPRTSIAHYVRQEVLSRPIKGQDFNMVHIKSICYKTEGGIAATSLLCAV